MMLRDSRLLCFLMLVAGTVLATIGSSHPLLSQPAASIRLVENRGQIADVSGALRPDVLYASGSGGVQVFLRTTGISYVFADYHGLRPYSTSTPGDNSNRFDPNARVDLYRLDLELVGARRDAHVVASDPAPQLFNYYYPHARNGVTGVRGYAQVVYRDIYPKIDMVVRVEGSGLKYEFVVHPGGDPGVIKMKYVGATRIDRRPEGGLRVVTPLGEVVEGRPVSYSFDTAGMFTWGGGARYPVDGSFVVDEGTIGFDIEEYDRDRLLVIDPTLLWSTYFGGYSSDYSSFNFSSPWAGGQAVVTDSGNGLLVAGITSSSNFPVSSGAYQTTLGGVSDACVIKLNAAGQRVWSTLYGGNGYDGANGVGIDRDRNVFIVGTTYGGTFPVSSNSLQETFGGNSDAFLVKFDSTGVRRWGTFFGATGSDAGTSVAVDGVGNALITGLTNSAGLASSGASQSSIAGGDDAFVLKVSPTGSLVWSSYFGGRSTEYYGTTIAVDPSGNAYLAGSTYSTDMPVSSSAFQSRSAGSIDAFIAKFSDNGTRLWSTYIGGNSVDVALGLIVSDSSIYLAGLTYSSNLPTTSGAFQRNISGSGDGYLMRLDQSGNRQWLTFYGGGSLDWLAAGDVDERGWVTVAGYTASSNLPVTIDAYQSTLQSADAVIVQFDSTGGRKWASYYGGSGSEWGLGVVAERSGVVVAGTTSSSNFPVAGGAFQASSGGGYDLFISRFCTLHPTINVTGPTRFCPGDSTLLTAGSGYDSYLWSTGETTQQIVARGGGRYWVRVSTGVCYGYSDSVDISVHQVVRPTITLNGSAALCPGDSTELIIPPTYISQRWSTGDTSRRLVVRQSGVYSVTAYDINGCPSTSDTVRITLNPKPNALIMPAGPIRLCEGDSVRLDVGPTYSSYFWSTGQTTPSIIVKDPGVYSVRVMNVNGCFDVVSTNVTVYPAPKVKISALAGPSACRGDSIVLTASSGFVSYKWSTGETTQRITLRRSEVVKVTVVDTNGCLATAVLGVNLVPNPPVAIKRAGPARICQGDSVILDAGTGYVSYLWSNGETSQLISVKKPGRYSVIATGFNGCPAFSDTVDVTIAERASVTVNGPASVCPRAGATYSVPLLPGTRYEWRVSGAGGTVLSGATTNSVLVRWGETGRGEVHLTAISEAGCVDTALFTTDVGGGLVPTITYDRAPDLCGDESVTLDAGAGYTSYLWSTGETTQQISVNTAGSYTVIVMDDAGCYGSSKPVVVNQLAARVPTVSVIGNSTFCVGDSVVLDAGAGFVDYLWSNGYRTRQITVREGGSYGVVVVDSNGCSASSAPVAVQSEAINASTPAGPLSVCRASTAVYWVTPRDRHSYEWSVEGGQIVSGGNTALIQVAWGDGRAGVVRLRERNALGCSIDAEPMTIAIGNSLQPEIRATGSTSLCAGGSVTLDAGDGYASYRWSTGDTTRSIVVRTNGSYSVVVTAQGGCSGISRSIDVTVAEPVEVKIAPGTSLAICEGESVQLDAPAGLVRYRWSTGDTTRSIVVSREGNYTVTVDDSAGCSATAIATVSVMAMPERPTIVSRGSSLESSTDGLLRWYRDGRQIPGGTGRIQPVLGPGVYQVEVSNANGCVAMSNPLTIAAQQWRVWVDTARAEVGTRFSLSVRIDPPLQEKDSVTKYSVNLGIPVRSAFPRSAVDGAGAPLTPRYDMSTGEVGVLTLERSAGRGPLVGSEIAKIEFEALATGVPVNTVWIRSVDPIAGEVPALVDGMIFLTGCEINRGISAGKQVHISALHPNPVGNVVSIRYSAPEGVVPTLRLTGVSGTALDVVELPAGTGSESEYLFDVRGIPSGVYMLELRDRGERSIVPLVIVK